MSAGGREAAPDYSRGPQASRGPSLSAELLRKLCLALALAGVAALVLATFTTIVKITVGTTSDLAGGRQSAFTGFDRHSVGLLLVAAVALPMAIGAWRGARPANVMLLVCAVTALVIALAIDLPDIHTTGTVGRDYASATAGPGLGYYAETLAAVLLLAAGGGLLVLDSGRRAASGA